MGTACDTTSETITQAGARVIFVDIDPSYYTMDTSKIEEKITNKNIIVERNKKSYYNSFIETYTEILNERRNIDKKRAICKIKYCVIIGSYLYNTKKVKKAVDII